MKFLSLLITTLLFCSHLNSNFFLKFINDEEKSNEQLSKEFEALSLDIIKVGKGRRVIKKINYSSQIYLNTELEVIEHGNNVKLLFGGYLGEEIVIYDNYLYVFKYIDDLKEWEFMGSRYKYNF